MWYICSDYHINHLISHFSCTGKSAADEGGDETPSLMDTVKQLEQQVVTLNESNMRVTNELLVAKGKIGRLEGLLTSRNGEVRDAKSQLGELEAKISNMTTTHSHTVASLEEERARLNTQKDSITTELTLLKESHIRLSEQHSDLLCGKALENESSGEAGRSIKNEAKDGVISSPSVTKTAPTAPKESMPSATQEAIILSDTEDGT